MGEAKVVGAQHNENDDIYLTYSPEWNDGPRPGRPARQVESLRAPKTLLIAWEKVDDKGDAVSDGVHFYMPLPVDDLRIVAKLGRRNLQIAAKTPDGDVSRFTSFRLPTLDSHLVSREHATFTLTPSTTQPSLVQPAWRITARDSGSRHGIFDAEHNRIDKTSDVISQEDGPLGFFLGAEVADELIRSEVDRAMRLTFEILPMHAFETAVRRRKNGCSSFKPIENAHRAESIEVIEAEEYDTSHSRKSGRYALFDGTDDGEGDEAEEEDQQSCEPEKGEHDEEESCGESEEESEEELISEDATSEGDRGSPEAISVDEEDEESRGDSDAEAKGDGDGMLGSDCSDETRPKYDDTLQEEARVLEGSGASDADSDGEDAAQSISSDSRGSHRPRHVSDGNKTLKGATRDKRHTASATGPNGSGSESEGIGAQSSSVEATARSRFEDELTEGLALPRPGIRFENELVEGLAPPFAGSAPRSSTSAQPKSSEAYTESTEARVGSKRKLTHEVQQDGCGASTPMADTNPEDAAGVGPPAAGPSKRPRVASNDASTLMTDTKSEDAAVVDLPVAGPSEPPRVPSDDASTPMTDTKPEDSADVDLPVAGPSKRPRVVKNASELAIAACGGAVVGAIIGGAAVFTGLATLGSKMP